MTGISIVLPTRNEEENIAQLLSHFNFASKSLEYETIVVDDSTDQTAEIARRNGARVLMGKHQGLGQAIIDGIEASQRDIVVVMDTDGSHRVLDIPNLIKPLIEQGYDMTIGSRYCKSVDGISGSLGDWSTKRKLQSIIGVKIMQLVTGVKDSNSGFFAFRRSIIGGVKLKPTSWKIMLEVLFKANITARQEIPIQFGERLSGESKNNLKERVRHAKHLIGLVTYKMRRYISFAIVGGIGALWYFGLLYTLTEYAHLWYMLSAVIATIIAATHNYILNHFITFRKSKARNRNLAKGWTKYLVAVGIGDGTDLLILFALTEAFGIWYMLSALLASFVASIIKFSITKQWVWGRKGLKANDAGYEWNSFYKGKPYQKLWKHIIANAVKKLAGDAGEVLDIGCGSSPLGVSVNHKTYTGLDKNADKIEFMRKKIMSGAQFETGTTLGLPYENSSFDTILFIEAIEHLNSWREVYRTLDEIGRVLRPGGTVIIATPNYGGWTGRLQDKLYGIFQPAAYADEHRIKFNPEVLADLCKEHDLILQDKIIPLNADMVCKFKKEE